MSGSARRSASTAPGDGKPQLRALVALLAVAPLLAGCGSSADVASTTGPPSTVTTRTPPPTSTTAADDDVERPSIRQLVRPAEPGDTIELSGSLIGSVDEVRLCNVELDSLPPQCAPEDSVVVIGAPLADLGLRSLGGVYFGGVTVTVTKVDGATVSFVSGESRRPRS